MNFLDKLASARKKNDSLLCIGLDPDPALMPQGISIADFNRAIIEATGDLVCAFKPNLAFYEAMGSAGMAALEKTLKHIPADVLSIGDGKRGDIGNTSRAYAKALFDGFGFDSVTVNPYLGYDSIEPFMKYTDKGVFLLCRTSNPGGADFQNLKLENGQPLYEAVARKALEWNKDGNIGLVAGATNPAELRHIREICPEMPILIPGIGAQSGDLGLTVKNGVDRATIRTIITVSRQVLYASAKSDFAEAARKVALELRSQINSHLVAH
ncbi:MAG: orotidine-5'-phosphate decarboxylase [Chloroflexota bacterium]